MDDITTQDVNRSLSRMSTERMSKLYASCLALPEGLEEIIPELLSRKMELKKQFLKAQDEKMILNEIVKNPQEWLTFKDAEKHREMSEEEEVSTELEMNAVLQKRMDEMNEVIETAATVIDTWKNNADLLSQKIMQLKSKMAVLGDENFSSDSFQWDLESKESNNNKLNFLKMEVKNAHEKLNILLEAAQKERDIILDRIARMETTIQHLNDSQSQLERRCLETKKQLESWKKSLTDMEMLCGLHCHVVDHSTLQIVLQGKDLIKSSDLSMDSSEGLIDCKFSANLKFAENAEGSVEIYDVQTDESVKGIDKLIEEVKQDKDLPKFVLSLRNTWLSHLPLNAEICCLRRNHAIDFLQEQGVLQLIINKRNIVCTLKVPKFYPHSDVILMNVMGHPNLTAENISAPSIKTLTSWVKYLEDLLGQQ